ncbi:MAG TPA: ATPase [Syntrophales bacterium]|jgi:predicted ATPase with chaperone activity|nr:ATPase [Syntrophales bacterium]
MTPANIAITRSIEETGVRKNLLEELALKIIYLVGETSLLELARRMGLSYKVVEELFQRLRTDQLCQVTGMAGGTHRIVASSSGKSRALELLAQNQYAGPAPVSLEDYVDRTRTQSVLDNRITPDDVTRAFADLVLDHKTLHQIGVAATSGRGIFLYGPTGTGKTTIAESLTRLFEKDTVWVPYAVEVDGQIITVYDAVLHQRLEQSAGPEQDGRWVKCRRPRMMVGGELTIEMLDLQFNPATRFYTGPVQMKANNGILIIDDFGRQRVSPEELLNRWVVPLDRRVDFITLAGGRKIEIPFDLLVIFATNLDPAKLVDEAFLRRIQTKIRVDFMKPDQFREIFRRLCEKHKLGFEPVLADELIRLVEQEYGEPLRACYPRDILQQVLWMAQYRQKEPTLDRKALGNACQNYFLDL